MCIFYSGKLNTVLQQTNKSLAMQLKGQIVFKV